MLGLQFYVDPQFFGSDFTKKKADLYSNKCIGLLSLGIFRQLG